MSRQNWTTQSNNGKNNKKMGRKFNVPFNIQSFPISAIRHSHYKTKRKEIKITLENNKKTINIIVNNDYWSHKLFKLKLWSDHV